MGNLVINEISDSVDFQSNEQQIAEPAQPAQPLNVIQHQPEVPQAFATIEQNPVPIQQNNFVPQNIAAEQYPTNQQYIQQQAAQPVYQQAAVPVNQVQIGAQPTATRAYQQQFVPQ